MDSMKNEEIPPVILAFAQKMRDTFGTGVKLYLGKPWAGGCNGRGRQRVLGRHDPGRHV